MARKDILKKMEEILVRRRDALRQAIDGDDSLLQEFRKKHQGGDVVDFASDSAFGELSSQLAEVESRELKNVDGALKRIKDKSYGKCEACKKSIPITRLQALPYTSFCINCKRKAEDAGIEPGAVTDWSTILDSGDSVTDMDLNIN